jgi:hypothetical protein
LSSWRSDFAPLVLSLLRGTEGSNPAPSSGESIANLTSSITAKARPVGIQAGQTPQHDTVHRSGEPPEKVDCSGSFPVAQRMSDLSAVPPRNNPTDSPNAAAGDGWETRVAGAPCSLVADSA